MRVVPETVERWLGYAPQADVLLQDVATGRRIWVELEISRADPVANHAKFATAHLFEPMPTEDVFVSMVSRHVDRGRSNLAAHTIALMRSIGVRAFQTALLPSIDRDEIKRLNHLPPDQLDREDLVASEELKRVLVVSGAIGRVLESDIHLAANLVEVLYNVKRWNQDMERPEFRERWGLRHVRYFVHDPRTNGFAPSKFAAYVRLPVGRRSEWTPESSLTGLTVASYTEIDQQHPLFDGRRAWNHLVAHLHMSVRPLSELPSGIAEHFWRWAERHGSAIAVNAKGPVILSPPAWMV